ncbi:hypothetical protein [Paraburkholderia aspalathi]|uniref:hypothetical protein n=1 Tax=Paraburkholderia aspalathi TaxID=1324617 RepID=UPI00116063A2|nr:hypothetical protein [Paraburkholderia aspalathi]
MRVVDVTLKAGLLSNTVTFTECGKVVAKFNLAGGRLPFFNRPVDLWKPTAERDFKSAFGKSGIPAAIDQRMFNRPEPLVLRIGPAERAPLPWEAFQGLLHLSNQLKFAPLRTVDPDQAFHFDKLDSPMRVLALVGHPGKEPAFDAQDAETFLAGALKAASATHPTLDSWLVRQVNEENLTTVGSEAASLAPNVLIFFGHGEHLPSPRIRLSGGEQGWMPLSDFVDRLFAKASTRPPFWIFWACSLAEDGDQPRMRFDAPEVLRVLGERRAVSVLAMRSRIRVKTAQAMLETLIGAFSAGEPLEVAAALARAAALSLYPEAGGRLDYAAPAVWSLSEPVAQITWGAREAFPASWVTLPLIAAGSEFPELATGLAPVSDEVAVFAETLTPPGRYFLTVQSTINVAQEVTVRVRLSGIAAIIRRNTGRPVVPILLRAGATFDSRIEFWAKDVYQYLDPRFHDRQLALAIKSIAEEGLNGVRRLLAIPGMVVLFSEPPDRAFAWQMLANAPEHSSVVVLGQTPPDNHQAWKLDQFTFPVIEQQLLEAIAVEPLGCAILGVAERPLNVEEVAHAAGTSPELLDRLDPFTIRIGGRRVLGESARMIVQNRSDPKIIAKAREACIELLKQRPVEHDFDATVEVARQYLALGDISHAAEAINAAWAQVGRTWSIQKRVILLELAARHRELSDRIDEVLLMDIVAAGINVQNIGIAQLILEHHLPRTLKAQARRHAMLAECLKGRPGNTAVQQAMWRHARDAVDCAERAATQGAGMSAVDVLHFKHNLARLRQYFLHEYDEALQVYEEIRGKLRPGGQENADDAYLFAAASRNAAECLLDPAPRPIDNAVRDCADAFITDGLEVAQPFVELTAELLYTRARIAQASNDLPAAAQVLAELTTGEVAQAYPLVARIAADRLAWIEVGRGRAFTSEELRGRLNVLDGFYHMWAVRVAIRSRVRGAKLLAARGLDADLKEAEQLLGESAAQFRRLTNLTGAEDVQNAAVTFAGLDVLAGGKGEAWHAFLKDPRAERLPSAWKELTAKDIWGSAD